MNKLNKDFKIPLINQSTFPDIGDPKWTFIG